MATLDEKEVLIYVIKDVIGTLIEKGYSGTPILAECYQKKVWLYKTNKEEINYRNTMDEIKEFKKEADSLPIIPMYSEEVMELARREVEETKIKLSNK